MTFWNIVGLFSLHIYGKPMGIFTQIFTESFQGI